MINWNVNVIGINRVSGGIVPEYQAYLDNVVDRGYDLPTPELQVIQNKYMKDLKSIGLEKFETVRLFANENIGTALVNFVNPTINAASRINSTPFIQYYGFTGSGTARIADSLLLTEYTKYKVIDAHIYLYVQQYTPGNTNLTSGCSRVGVSVAQVSTNRVIVTDKRAVHVNINGGDTLTGLAEGKGLCGVRLNDTENLMYVDGGNKYVRNATGTPIPQNVHFNWLAREDYNGSIVLHIHQNSSDHLGLATLGAGLTDQDVADLHTASEEYITNAGLLI